MNGVNILPYPLVNFIPKIMRDYPDAGTNALVAKLDELILRWEASGLGIADLNSPEKCPEQFLSELGYLLNAGIDESDSEQEKRVKVATAVASHKIRGSWTKDAKPKIDAITGTDTELVKPTDSAEWVWFDDGGLPYTEKWGVWDGGIPGDEYGLLFLSNGNEMEIKGNVYIDLKTSGLSAAQIQAIRDEIEADVVPAYFRVFLGYFSGGFWVTYPNGIIE